VPSVFLSPDADRVHHDGTRHPSRQTNVGPDKMELIDDSTNAM
jgi:hypothetical protein